MCSEEDQCETSFFGKLTVLLLSFPISRFLLVHDGLMKLLVGFGHARSMEIIAEKGFEVLYRS